MTRSKMILTLVSLAAVFLSTSMAQGAVSVHQSRPRKRTPHCEHKSAKRKHHQSCSGSTRRRHPTSAKASTPTTSAPVPASSATPLQAPEPTLTPVCPTSVPFRTAVAGETTIVGYAWLSGGSAPVPSQVCPGRVSAPATVDLETTGGQLLESQTVEAGHPYEFVVQPGEYEIVDTLCMAEELVKAPEGQQTIRETACDIP
jgi:hypothetical protein